MEFEIANNIFQALGKYNSAVDENYLTESFVFLLNFLLEKEPLLAIRILRKLCINDSEYDFEDNQVVEISTQVTTNEGRPDIRISTPDKLIFVEVKHDSGLGYQQIERYKTALNSSNASIRKVILLTKFPEDFEEEQGRPDKHVRWFEVAHWLSELDCRDSVSEYFIKAFLKFLEMKNMTVQKISWEYINGFDAFRNLINMLSVALEEIPLKLKKSAGWEWTGFYPEVNNRIFCGIYHNAPLLIVMEAYDAQTENKTIFKAVLNLEDVHFFSLTKDEQIQRLSQFVKEQYKEAKMAMEQK